MLDHSQITRRALLLGLALGGCASDPEPRRGVQRDAASSVHTDQGMGEQSDAGQTDRADAAEPQPNGMGYMVIQDETEVIFDHLGSDIDAVVVDCSAGKSNVVGTWGHNIEDTTDMGSLVQGPPEVGCAPADCATTIPVGKWIGLSFDVVIRQGCEVTVYEAADQGNNRFNVYVCTAPDFTTTACQLLTRDVDGSTTTTEVP